MKDAYSFHLDKADAQREYAKMYDAYRSIFARLGLVAIPVKADTGAIGGDLSHEFQVIAGTGESALYYDATFDDIRMGKVSLTGDEMRGLYGAADEQHDPENCPITPERLREARGIEVGHIFYLGQKYTEAMNVKLDVKEGEPVHPHMGCYGIGVSRLVGAVIEASHDEHGIIWPEAIAPFTVGINNLKVGDAACDTAANELYEKLISAGVSVLYDDTDARAGEKFTRMDLIGLPHQIAIGPRAVKNGVVEIKNRKTGEKEELSVEAVMANITVN